jgi:hypothetical protein
MSKNHCLIADDDSWYIHRRGIPPEAGQRAPTKKIDTTSSTESETRSGVLLHL